MLKNASTFCLSLLLYFAVPAQAQDADFDLDEIVQSFDELYRSQSSSGKMEMIIITPNWERTLRMDVWSKGQDKTFVRILAPKKEKGVATLRIDNEMWNYLPKTNKVIKIPPSMMMNSWMGSDFTNDDLVNEFTMSEDYTYQLIEVPGGRSDLLYVEFIPREGLPIVWGKIVVALRKSDYLPVWEKDYDEKGNLIRIMNFNDIRTFDGKKLPAEMELIPQNKEGHKTLVRYLDLEFDQNIEDSIFSLRNLRAAR